jgi:hypothetical protein
LDYSRDRPRSSNGTNEKEIEVEDARTDTQSQEWITDAQARQKLANQKVKEPTEEEVSH